jgi:hypothetical protein
MKISAGTAILFLCTFFASVLAVSFMYNRHYPVTVLGGEDSVGTWMSGVLLTFMATLCLFISMKQRWYPWIFFTIFFLLLALDERFMFHERIKERIIFSSHSFTLSRWIYELPVLVGACLGGCLALLMYRHLPLKGRVLLAVVVLSGTVSVAIDVMAKGVFWEECFKLLAELLMACVLLLTVEDESHRE